MSKALEIRKEFERPFAEVIRQFAIDGYSKRATAEILEINRSYFLKLIARYAPDATWKYHGNLRRECRSYGMDYRHDGHGFQPGHVYKTNKYTDSELLAEVSKYATYAQYRNNSKIAWTTVYRRFNCQGWNGIKKLAEGQTAEGQTAEGQ